RVREKQLLVKVLKADIVDRYEAGPCQFHLDSPNERKRTQLDDASLNARVSFDLSSRSSQLEITVWPKAASPKSNVDPIGKSTVSVDAIDMEKCNKVAAPLKAVNSDEIIGSLHLEFMVMENAQSNPSLLKRYSFSGPDQKTPMFPDQDLDQKPLMNEEKVAKQSENKSKMSSSPSA
uniref:C2 NT-type domain-containing protein n=1 Tax=Ciona savignyi TaxID=51511 RepID=H2Z1N6_CIOSA